MNRNNPNAHVCESVCARCARALLRARVCVSENFWVAYVRCFIRLDGVMSRVIDTRYSCRLGAPGRPLDNVVLRERSWREGSWEDLVGSVSPFAG